MYQGDKLAGETLYFDFNTASFTDGSPITLAGTPSLRCYKNDSTTESTAGLTLTVDFDAVTGAHMVKVDTSADGTFYAAGNDFSVKIAAGTVGGTSVVGRKVGSFSLENRCQKADVRKLLGTAWLTPGTAGTPDVNTKLVGGTAQTAKDLGAINVTNLNTLSSHDPGATLGTSTLTQTQVTGGAYSVQSASCVLGDNRIGTLNAIIGSTDFYTQYDDGNLLVTVASVTGAVGSVTARVTANVDRVDGVALGTHHAGYFPADVRYVNDVSCGSVTTVGAYIGGTGDAYAVANTRLPAALTADGNMKSDPQRINGVVTTGVTTIGTHIGTTGAGATATAVAAVQTDVTTLLGRIGATLFSGITSVAQWLGLIAGKQTGNSTARTELRATGAGSGVYDETIHSLQATRDLVYDSIGDTSDQLDNIYDQTVDNGDVLGIIGPKVDSILSATGDIPTIMAVTDDLAQFAADYNNAALACSVESVVNVVKADNRDGGAIPTAADWGASVVGNGRTRDMYLQGMTNKIAFDVPGVGQYTVYASNDSTPLVVGTYVADASANPVTRVDPT